MQQFKKNFWIIVKISLAVGLIFYLVKNEHLDLTALWQSLAGDQILLFLFISFVLHFLMTLRLQWVLKMCGVQCDYAQLLKFNFIGVFFNYFLPGSVSGDVVKSVYIANHTNISKARALLGAALDRAFALYTMLMGSMIAMVVSKNIIMWADSPALDFISQILMLSFVFVTLLTFVFLRWTSAPNVQTAFSRSRLLSSISEGAQTFKKSPRLVVQILFLSLIGQSLYVYLFKLITDNLAHSNFVSYWAHFFAQSVGLILTAIPITPAGIGVGQTVFHFLYGEILGDANTIGATAITVVQVLGITLGLIGAYFFVRTKKANTVKK